MKRTLLFFCAAFLIHLEWASAQIVESEGNDSKATANFGVLQNTAGLNTITGNSTSASAAGLDYFRFQIAGLTPGLYRHRLILSSNTAGHTGTIRGLNQTGTGAGAGAGTGGTIGATDTTVQTSSTLTTPARFNQFYGFGIPTAEMYYRVTGAAATTSDYVATLETTPITPTNIGSYNEGNITISTIGQGHTTDTDFWVYDSSFNAISGYGNDDNSAFGGGPSTGLQSIMTRSFTPGTYYLAMSNFNLANNLASPTDERAPSGAVLDFPGFLVNSSTTANLNLAFTIGDGITTNPIANTKLGAYDVNWFEFTVIPEPSSALVLCLVGMSVLARRRR